ncbi:COG1361 S-layer family protein [Candidatus Woesearchaeota archaeon]|nr:COG1361 S-layer family protein [Candidatus Woesearchaeota archaeon]
MKYNKNAIFALMAVCILLLSAVVIADVATYVSGASIRVSMISQDPDPVGPGEYVELRWMVINYGSKPLENVEFKLVTDYPFEMIGSAEKGLGTIQGHQEGEEGVVLYYKVRIDEDASEGVNKLYLMYRYKGMEDWTKLDYFEVRVQSVDAAVVIDAVKVEPSRISPGTTGTVNIKLKNLADSLMKNINVKLDLTLETIPRSATGAESSLLYEALPFAPTDSSSEKRIQSIKPGATAIVSYDLMAYSDATSKVYKVPVILTYKDELDNEYEKNDIIGVVVGAEPDIYVVIDSSDLVAGKKYGKVSFKFVNRGVTDVKFVDVVLEKTSEYDVISASEEYIGNIDSDDFETVDFSIYLMNNIDAKTSHDIEFPVKLTFKDANNNDYTEEVKLNYRIYTAEQKGQAKSQSAMIIVIAVIIIIVGWIVYRRWEKRRKAKAQAQKPVQKPVQKK